MSYLLALDQGTTSSRAIIFNPQGQIQAIAQTETKIHTPQSGWVEQDAHEIWSSQLGVVQQALASAGILAKDICALGLTNQRETTVVWDKRTGRALAPAIIWQDRRAAAWCNQLIEKNLGPIILKKTGLRMTPILVQANWFGYLNMLRAYALWLNKAMLPLAPLTVG